MQHILMTGATGVLGSELLYHLLYEKLVENEAMEFHLVVRPAENESAAQRIEQLFDPKILPSKLLGYSQELLLNQVNVIEGDLKHFDFEPNVGVTLIHSAAIVRLDSRDKTRDQIIKNNYQATIDLVNRFSDRLEHMIFVSTAYACGAIDGEVDNNYLRMDEGSLKFRNYYEEYKFKAEQAVNELADKHGFDLSIVRPSIICGRLIVEPHYVMNRYIVFYLMGKFFQEMAKVAPDRDQVVRIQAVEDVSLNMIPVDYVAKTIVRVLRNKDIKQLNIVNSVPFPMKNIVEKSMAMNGYKNLVFVNEEPADKTALETVFYKTVARQLVQYVDASHHTFDTTELRSLMHDVVEPNLDDTFDSLFEFAQDRNYQN